MQRCSIFKSGTAEFIAEGFWETKKLILFIFIGLKGGCLSLSQLPRSSLTVHFSKPHLIALPVTLRCHRWAETRVHTQEWHVWWNLYATAVVVLQAQVNPARQVMGPVNIVVTLPKENLLIRVILVQMSVNIDLLRGESIQKSTRSASEASII